MLEIIKSPWEGLFFNLLAKSKQHIYLACPFIKSSTANKIVANCQVNTIDFRFINSFKLSNFYNGSSDLEALKVFERYNIKQKSVHKLHAKIFIFDNGKRRKKEREKKCRDMKSQAKKTPKKCLWV